MSLVKIVVETDRAWALWRIDEDESTLAACVAPVEQVAESITNASKRLEWLAGRVLVKELFGALRLNFQGITKDEHGKPFPVGYDYHLSLSHSYPFVAALVDKRESVGIDLEQPKEKLLRIAHRVFHEEELRDAGQNLTKLCIYWCAKEAMIKVYGKKHLVFAENILTDPFPLAEEGDIRGRIIVSATESVVPLHYIVYPEFVLVFNQRARS